MIQLKTPGEIEIMDRANAIVLAVLDRVGAQLRPGVVLRDLDDLAESATRELGGKPAFKGYHGYPASICISVNDEVVHGIPGGRKFTEHRIQSLRKRTRKRSFSENIRERKVSFSFCLFSALYLEAYPLRPKIRQATFIPPLLYLGAKKRGREEFREFIQRS